MVSVIIAFPKPEAAKHIKRILVQKGYSVTGVCTTGAQALQSANELDGGLVICGYRFVDMTYRELYEYLPPGFEMLLVAPPAKCGERDVKDLVCLETPLKVNELLQTVEMMEYTISRRRRKSKKRPKERSEEEAALLDAAKTILMDRNDLTEEEAHRYIQKRSMDNGTGLMETAQMIISLFTS